MSDSGWSWIDDILSSLKTQLEGIARDKRHGEAGVIVRFSAGVPTLITDKSELTRRPVLGNMSHDQH